MKKIFIFIIALIIPLNVFGFELSSKNAYFVNLDRDEVIYELNSKEEISIASLTKIMTCIVALEHIDNLDEQVTLTSKDFKGLREANASTAGFRKGDIVTYRDLLYGLMLPSGADAALALSNNIAGSEKEFVKLMNEKVKELKLENTNFVNTTGLDTEGHYSSVYDVSVILKYALQNETFKEIFTTNKYKATTGLTFKSSLASTSSKFNLDVDYIIGSKTGYTYDAGLCLASIATNDGETFLLITARADYKSKKPYHITDSDKIYRYYFDNYSYRPILKEDDVILKINNEFGEETVYHPKENIEMYIKNDAVITTEYKGKELLTTDMKVGDLIGTYEIYASNELIYAYDIYLDKAVINYSEIDLMTCIIAAAFIIFIIIALIINKKGKSYD